MSALFRQQILAYALNGHEGNAPAGSHALACRQLVEFQANAIHIPFPDVIPAAAVLAFTFHAAPFMATIRTYR